MLYEVITVDDVQTGVYHYPAQQDKRGETTLVEIKVEQVEGKENPDKRNRDHKNNGERLQQRFQQNGA